MKEMDVGYTIDEVRSDCISQSLTYDELLVRVTNVYLSELDLDNKPIPAIVKRELVELTNECVDAYNNGEEDCSVGVYAKKSERYPNKKEGSDRYKKAHVLLPIQIGMCLRLLHHAVCICWESGRSDGNYDIGIYQEQGYNQGCYDVSTDGVESVIRAYNHAISLRDVAEVVAVMRTICPHVERNTNPDFVAVNNGIFDYRNKILLDFDPEIIFTSKSHVDFNPNAQNPIIHNDVDGTDWNVEDWMRELSDDDDVIELLWRILGSIIRPNVSWNKTAWFYSTLGNNGKGTLCVLMRNLCGAGAWASIPLKAFSEQFMLEPLTRVSAVITDENDTGTFVDDAAALKSIITHDPFQINRKFKDPRSLLFRGFMVQCVNELPKLKDKSESMYRRLLVVPFDKRFEGHERKYIKDDYLYRKDVLEYVLYRVLYDMTYYELNEPDVCLKLLNEYKEFNDPIRQFCEDTLPRFSWDLIPWDMLYAFYEGWFHRYNPSGRIQNKTSFIREFKQILDEYSDWKDTINQVRTHNRMDYCEPLILEYDVKSLFSRTYKGVDPAMICKPDVPNRARGIMRSANALRIRRTINGNVIEHDSTNGSDEESE